MSKKIKIGYFADGPWSWAALELIVQDHDCEILFIVPRIGSQDQNLRQLATKYSIPYLENYKINSPDFLSAIKPYDFNLFVSMSFDQIFKADILKAPALGTINCHAGKLPFYRGRNVLNWAIINDEKEIGVTVHYVDKGIDTGDIIYQTSIPLTDEDDYGTILDLAYEICAQNLHHAIRSIATGKINIIKQASIHPDGLYCGKRMLGDEIINWNQSSRDIFNFIRAITTPGPNALTHLGEKKIKLIKSRYIKDIPSYKGIPGQILGKTEHGFFIKTLDSYLEIVAFESEVALKVGDRFN